MVKETGRPNEIPRPICGATFRHKCWLMKHITNNHGRYVQKKRKNIEASNTSHKKQRSLPNIVAPDENTVAPVENTVAPVEEAANQEVTEDQALSQSLVFRFKVWMDGTQQADSSTPSRRYDENYVIWTIPRLCRKGSGNQLRERKDDMTNQQRGQHDQPVELVE